MRELSPSEGASNFRTRSGVIIEDIEFIVLAMCRRLVLASILGMKSWNLNESRPLKAPEESVSTEH